MNALEAQGQAGLIMGTLWHPMLAMAAATFVLVVGALGWALLRRRGADEPTLDAGRERSMARAVGAAVGLTIAVLLVCLVLDISVGRAITATPGEQALQIRVTGHQWWWEVHYRDSVAQRWVTTANEIHVPVGKPVAIELRSTDVIHSFWPPSLTGKRDLIPGSENTLWLRAERPGVYRGQCAEYCGHQHAKMAFEVIAQPADSFARWLEAQRDTAMTPTSSLARRGQEVFLTSSCVMCHAIGGTPAGSRVGPDLTHLASRRDLAAATLKHTRGNLAAWIVDPQSIKPGSQMPMVSIAPDELDPLLSYLEGLK